MLLQQAPIKFKRLEQLVEVSYEWKKGNVTPIFKKARGKRILRTQRSILFNDLDVTKSAFSASA